VRALICRAHGGPESLEIGGLPDPEPAHGEVVVRVQACGINFPDLLTVAGKYQIQPPLPFAPGAEVAGVIERAGEGVGGLTPGQRVLAYCGHGGLAELVAVPSSRVLPIPDAMPVDEAAAFLIAYGTAWYALRNRGQLQRGETLLVLGAAGGVGLAAVQLGEWAGARVIAVASDAGKREFAAQNGASDVIGYSNLRDDIRSLTSGRGIDVVLDPVGGEHLEPALRSTAWNGRVLIVGFASGVVPRIAMNLPLLKGISIVGVFWGEFTRREPEAAAKLHRELLDAWVSGGVAVRIAERYELERASEALARMASRRVMGKLVVVL
jgi:NADPH2:quinone reductase